MDMWLILYLSSIGLSLTGVTTYSILCERAKKRWGYVNLEHSFFYNCFLKDYKRVLLFAFVTLFPVINFYSLFPFIKIKKNIDKEVTDQYDDGEIITIEKALDSLGDYSEDNNKMMMKVVRARKANNKYKKVLAKKKLEYDALKGALLEEKQVLTIPERVVNVRKLQDKNMGCNRIKPFSAYDYDEKISLLLEELELAYEEKALAEGIEIDKEVKLLLEDNNKKDN